MTALYEDMLQYYEDAYDADDLVNELGLTTKDIVEAFPNETFNYYVNHIRGNEDGQEKEGQEEAEVQTCSLSGEYI